jgi:uncharacterized protein
LRIANLEGVTNRVESFDLAPLRLTSGEGRHIDLEVALEPFELGGERYTVDPTVVPVRLDIARTTGEGYALRLRFEAELRGPCVRCLEPAGHHSAVDAREVEQPGSRDEELDSPYVTDQVLDVGAWANDALALTLPAKVLCRPDCAGLCPTCGVNLNEAGPEHAHEAAPDPRWAKLRELEL